ncbi:von Willebrand factor A domain-containing protein 2 isoform X1 [Denticeps clupeoides]|uniref:von Willebrand factor A domain-containing protein 2 isoform X1 n=2 Tax=Denticeps clupeoides TaxID=299321 RepID=UPI0010A4E15F|nr:von Willebrand factor A domain-containing protein 2 isoform X1 [Denticeps clupeoides]
MAPALFSARLDPLEQLLKMKSTRQLSLLFLLPLLLQVRPSLLVQEILVDHDTILKIKAAAEMMQCSAAVDVLFLLDGSYSVGKGSFERSKHLTLTLCDALDIRPDKVRVGVIQFSSTVRTEISLNSYSSRDKLKKHLKKITYRGGSTQTGLALKYVLKKGFSADRNSSIPRVLLLLSDGRSQGAVQQAATELKQSGVTVYTVGIRYPRWEELHALASAPVEQHVFFAEHYSDAVNGLCTALSTSAVCKAVPPGCKVQSFSCERKTLETVKELQGNFVCWKGSRGSSPYTSLCPFYSYSKKYKIHPAACHRTVCYDPCDSQPCQNLGTCVSEGLEKFHCVCPPGYGSDPHCAPALNLDCSVDVLFLVEGSTALSLEGFMRFKSFLKRFLQTVVGADTPTKIGLAQYGDDVKLEAKVGKHRDVTALLRMVDALQPRGGKAMTGKALQYITRHGFQSSPIFADVHDDLPRVVVLLTATPSTDHVVEPAKYARDREVFIIAVGPEDLKAQLNNITGNPQRSLTYSSPDRLGTKIPELRAKICAVDNQGCLGQPLDLIFVLDGSSGVGRDNFIQLKDFVRSVSVQFDINRDVAQMGLVVFGRRPVTVFDLDTHNSGSDILKAVAEASFLGGAASTGSALLHVHTYSLTVGKGARPGVNKAVVVLTDGTGAEDAVVPAQKLRDNGVFVFVVGIGDLQQESLLRIAGRADHMITVPFYEDLKYFDDVLVQMVCVEAKRPVDLCRPNPCMNDGMCVLWDSSYRCQCRGWEGPHCETRSTKNPSRGDLPRVAAPRRTGRKGHRDLNRRHTTTKH